MKQRLGFFLLFLLPAFGGHLLFAFDDHQHGFLLSVEHFGSAGCHFQVVVLVVCHLKVAEV